MKCLLLFAPQWIPFNPHLAGPAIHSILKNNGHDVRLRDLNIEFYNRVLTPAFLFDTIKNAFADYEQNAPHVLGACPDPGNLKNYPAEFQIRYGRYREILTMSRRNEYKSVIQRIERSVAVLRSKDAFYDTGQVDEALSVISKACGILSACYHPSRVYFLHPRVKIYHTVDSLSVHCENVAGNVFHKFFSDLIPSLLENNPDFIGISIGDYSQLLAGLTLAMLLKRVSHAHVCIGGNLLGRHTDIIINNPDFFRLFADSVIFNEGEKPVVELLKCIEDKGSIEAVPNLIYLNDQGKVVTNDEAPPFPIEGLYFPEFSDMPAEKYFTPEVIFNIQASRNCYWKKCTFCTHHFGSRYAIKPVAKTITEIKSLQARHGTRFFHFIDEAVSPSYLRRLSQAIIDEGLDIRFYIYGRLEKAFDRGLFKLAYQAGLRLVLWGFESANERIYRLMNKGEVTDKNERLKILQAANCEGIWNFLFLMFNFPTETLEEAKETVDFVRDHRSILSQSTGASFMLMENSPILENLEKFFITNVQRTSNGFTSVYKFTATRGKTKDQKEELKAYQHAQWRLAEMRYSGSGFREKLFLYVCKFGVAHVSEMNREIWL
ncbi:MAG: radical SAM protein [Syntrophaceae bacterium]